MPKLIKFTGAAMLAMSARMAMADPDDAALRSYVLTMPKLEKYKQVNAAIAQSNDPAIRDEMSSLDNLLGGSIAEAQAKVRKAPHVEAIIRQKGLTDADYVMIPATLTGAAIATMAPPSAAATMPASAANIAFVKQHQAELSSMNGGHSE